MVSNFTLPPTGFGPGSQPAEDDVAYMPLPSGMRTYTPHTPDIDDPDNAAPVLTRLAAIADACDDAANGGPTSAFDLADLSPPARRLMAETLGEGEVSMKLAGIPALAVQESVFAGVWQMAGAGIDRVAVGPAPVEAGDRAFQPSRPAQGAAAPKPPGVLNAPALLAELLDKSGDHLPGAAPHVVNLTLLPHGEGDLAWLDAALGLGSVTILSRGYGNCRITATATPHVWRIQFFNSVETLILDTFEVADLPEVARAATEDLADSARRIRAVIEAIR
jgi:hydrogenase-1 operon protein HyaF